MSVFIYYLFIGFIFAILWDFVTCKVIKTGKYAYIKGYHFHHSLFGIISFLLALVFITDFQKAISFVIIGIGIIIQHTLTDGFRFITKERRPK